MDDAVMDTLLRTELATAWVLDPAALALVSAAGRAHRLAATRDQAVRRLAHAAGLLATRDPLALAVSRARPLPALLARLAVAAATTDDHETLLVAWLEATTWDVSWRDITPCEQGVA